MRGAEYYSNQLIAAMSFFDVTWSFRNVQSNASKQKWPPKVGAVGEKARLRHESLRTLHEVSVQSKYNVSGFRMGNLGA